MSINWEELIKEINAVSNDACNKEVKRMIEDGYQYSVHSGNSVVDHLYDVCGGAYVKFRDLRSSVYRSYKKFTMAKNESDPYGVFHEYESSGHQELCVNRAIAQSVADFLNKKFGENTVSVKCYID